MCRLFITLLVWWKMILNKLISSNFLKFKNFTNIKYFYTNLINNIIIYNSFLSVQTKNNVFISVNIYTTVFLLKYSVILMIIFF